MCVLRAYINWIHTYIYIYIERERGLVQVIPGVTLNNVTPLNIF